MQVGAHSAVGRVISSEGCRGGEDTGICNAFRVDQVTALQLADDRKVVMLSITSTLIAAVFILAATVAVSGGIASDLVRAYVLPLVISAFTLLVFWGVLTVASRSKMMQ